MFETYYKLLNHLAQKLKQADNNTEVTSLLDNLYKLDISQSGVMFEFTNSMGKQVRK